MQKLEVSHAGPVLGVQRQNVEPACECHGSGDLQTQFKTKLSSVFPYEHFSI